MSKNVMSIAAGIRIHDFSYMNRLPEPLNQSPLSANCTAFLSPFITLAAFMKNGQTR